MGGWAKRYAVGAKTAWLVRTRVTGAAMGYFEIELVVFSVEMVVSRGVEITRGLRVSTLLI